MCIIIVSDIMMSHYYIVMHHVALCWCCCSLRLVCLIQMLWAYLAQWFSGLQGCEPSTGSESKSEQWWDDLWEKKGGKTGCIYLFIYDIGWFYLLPQTGNETVWEEKIVKHLGSHWFNPNILSGFVCLCTTYRTFQKKYFKVLHEQKASNSTKHQIDRIKTFHHLKKMILKQKQKNYNNKEKQWNIIGSRQSFQIIMILMRCSKVYMHPQKTDCQILKTFLTCRKHDCTKVSQHTWKIKTESKAMLCSFFKIPIRRVVAFKQSFKFV